MWPETRARLRAAEKEKSRPTADPVLKSVWTPEMRRKTSRLIKGYSRDTYALAKGVRCDCCGFATRSGKLARDHDHANGKQRGALCAQCNQGLGLFRDDPVLLEKAAAYLRRF